MTRRRENFGRHTGKDGSGMADDFLSGLRRGQFGSVVDGALNFVRRNPVPSIAIAAGAGWLIYSMRGRARSSAWHRRMDEAEDIPVLNTGHARIYDPDASPQHPMQHSLESRRQMSARV